MSAEPLWTRSLDNARRALAELELFASLPIQHRRDRAGILQAFEFTFEVCWKYFQRRAEAEGLTAGSPKRALAAAFQMGLFTDEETWLAMLEARNLTSHTYHAELAETICRDVIARYLPALRQALGAAGG